MINSQLTCPRLITAKDIGPLIWKPPSASPRSAHLAQMRNFLAHKFGPGGVGSLALKPQSGASNDHCFGRFLVVSHQLPCNPISIDDILSPMQQRHPMQHSVGGVHFLE